MVEHPAQQRIADLIELAVASTSDPAERVMDLLVAASAIAAAQGPVNGTYECVLSGLGTAVACQEAWFPIHKGPKQ